MKTIDEEALDELLNGDPDDDISVTVRVTNTGIFLTIGGIVFAPSYEQAISIANSIDKEPSVYGLEDIPDKAKELSGALRAGAEIHRAHQLGVYKPQSKGTA